MNDPANRAERRGHRELDEGAGPPPFVYSRDPWDERRFNRFNPLFHWKRVTTSGWEAAAPFLLIAGGLAALALAISVVNALAH